MKHKTTKQIGLSKIVLSILICAFLTGVARGNEENRLYRIGVLAKRGKEICLKKWNPTARYLTDTVEGASFAIVPLDFPDVIPAVEKNTIDFLLANPGIYVRAEVKFGVERIATLENTCQGVPLISFSSIIFGRAERDDINDLADLKGKRMMEFKKAIKLLRAQIEEMGMVPAADDTIKE